MAAADRTEKVLRELHILFSKAPSFEGSRTNVVLDKNVVIDKLRDLRQCMYDMMNEYELTVQSREKANREAQRENDERVLAATKQAQDIYAASIMYSDRSLTELQEVLRQMQDNMEAMHDDMERRLKDELQLIKSNELELKSRLEGLMDTDMYLRLIEDANWRREKEKMRAEREAMTSGSAYTYVKADIRVNEDLIEAIGGGDAPPPLAEKNYSDIVPEIKINEAYFEKKGAEAPPDEPKGQQEPADEAESAEKEAEEIDVDAIGADLIAETLASESIVDEGAAESTAGQTQDISDEELAQISANLDAEYFDWKKEAEEELAAEEPKKKKFRKKRR